MPLRQPDLPIFTSLNNKGCKLSDNISRVVAKQGRLYQANTPKLTLHLLEDTLIHRNMTQCCVWHSQRFIHVVGYEKYLFTTLTNPSSFAKLLGLNLSKIFSGQFTQPVILSMESLPKAFRHNEVGPITNWHLSCTAGWTACLFFCVLCAKSTKAMSIKSKLWQKVTTYILFVTSGNRHEHYL